MADPGREADGRAVVLALSDDRPSGGRCGRRTPDLVRLVEASEHAGTVDEKHHVVPRDSKDIRSLGTSSLPLADPPGSPRSACVVLPFTPLGQRADDVPRYKLGITRDPTDMPLRWAAGSTARRIGGSTPCSTGVARRTDDAGRELEAVYRANAPMNQENAATWRGTPSWVTPLIPSRAGSHLAQARLSRARPGPGRGLCPPR